MKTLKSLIQQYGSRNAASNDLQVHGHQLARLVQKGALYNEKGDIYIPSKTKIKLVGAVNHDL